MTVIKKIIMTKPKIVDKLKVKIMNFLNEMEKNEK